MSISLSDVPVIVGILGLGGTFAVFCGKGILAFAELRTGLKTAIGFMERFEQKFDDAQNDAQQNYKEFRDCFSDHNEQFARHDSRLKTVEFVLDLDHRAQDFIDEARKGQKNRRTHGLRRTQDQVNDDVRRMVDLSGDDT